MERSPKTAGVVGLGANLGSPVESFRGAVRALSLQAEVLGISALYRSSPIGPPQPDYLNAGVLFRTHLDPASLLQLLRTIELAHGRVRRDRWGPRTLDLDVLWLEGTCVDSPELTVPHPRLTERAFALLPLLELVPEAIEPGSGRPYTKYLPGVQHQQIARLEGSWI